MSKSPNFTFIQKCQTTVYRNILPFYGTLNEKISYWGHIEGTTKPRGGYRYCHSIHFFGINVISLFMSLFKTAKGYIVYFPPGYGTLNEKKLLRAQQNQEGVPIPFIVTVYLWQNIRCRFSCCLGFRGRMFFLVVAKKNRSATNTGRTLTIVRNTTVTTQTQQGTTFLILAETHGAIKTCIPWWHRSSIK